MGIITTHWDVNPVQSVAAKTNLKCNINELVTDLELKRGVQHAARETLRSGPRNKSREPKHHGMTKYQIARDVEVRKFCEQPLESASPLPWSAEVLKNLVKSKCHISFSHEQVYLDNMYN
jgi:hypothetical protein